MNFLKLGNVGADVPDYSSDIGLIQFGETIDGEFRGIAYHRARIGFSKAIASFIPAWTLPLMEHTVMTINREVPPHVDNAISCVINIYLETSNCITQFYSTSSDEKSFQIANQTNGRIFDIGCLQPVDSFVANPGDIYILDVSKPHAVWPEYPGAPIKRTALCYQIRGMPFDTVISIVNGTPSPA